MLICKYIGSNVWCFLNMALASLCKPTLNYLTLLYILHICCMHGTDHENMIALVCFLTISIGWDCSCGLEFQCCWSYRSPWNDCSTSWLRGLTQCQPLEWPNRATSRASWPALLWCYNAKCKDFYLYIASYSSWADQTGHDKLTSSIWIVIACVQVTIPQNDTTYWCQSTEISEEFLTSTQYIIRVHKELTS